MGTLFSRADKSHPIYASGSSYIASSGLSARPRGLVATTVLHADPEAEAIERISALLAAGAAVDAPDSDEGVTALQAAARRGWGQVVAVLLAAGADPLPGQHRDAWPIFLVANAGHAQTSLHLLPGTLAAYASTLAPAVGGVTWLEPAWHIDLGDVEDGPCELLLGVREGWSGVGEIGAQMFVLLLDSYRVYYERVNDTVASFGGPPVIRGYAPQDTPDPHMHDREAVRRSMAEGYLGAASVALDLHFQGVEHEVEGVFTEMFE